MIKQPDPILFFLSVSFFVLSYSVKSQEYTDTTTSKEFRQALELWETEMNKLDSSSYVPFFDDAIFCKKQLTAYEFKFNQYDTTIQINDKFEAIPYLVGVYMGLEKKEAPVFAPYLAFHHKIVEKGSGKEVGIASFPTKGQRSTLNLMTVKESLILYPCENTPNAVTKDSVKQWLDNWKNEVPEPESLTKYEFLTNEPCSSNDPLIKGFIFDINEVNEVTSADSLLTISWILHQLRSENKQVMDCDGIKHTIYTDFGVLLHKGEMNIGMEELKPSSSYVDFSQICPDNCPLAH